ncbi:MAG: transglutaminase family protein [Polyangiaceae bacterium]|nr:transglutaminase family protein [Myxococcales bacterium]MCB9590683.1 transglutaminase family protein [Polyangiaceae bacterium]
MHNPEEGRSAESRLTAIERALSEHDEQLSDAGLVVWVGTEPTFTDRFSYDAEWVGAALGAQKLGKAQRFAAMLASRVPTAVLLRCVGRQYPEETTPRWSFGLYWQREAGQVWHLPPDPLMGGRASDASAPKRLLQELSACLTKRQRAPRRILLNDAPPPQKSQEQAGAAMPTLPLRLVWSVRDEELDELSEEVQEQCGRAPLGGDAIPSAGLSDPLADQGLSLLCVGDAGPEHPGVVRIELPQLTDVSEFSDLLELIGEACRAARIEGLILGGYPPPVDRNVAWATITPDPGVIEINTAPCSGTRGLLHDSRILYQVAEALGLSPVRMHYNGELVDSGGGGQITLGGPSFEESPFFRHPQLLSRMVCFFSRHPALSYLFAVDSVGGSSQSPRADEGSVETLAELGLALELLQRIESPSPEDIWSTLAPFLVDRFGNSHRAELNIEKLANPHLPGRGRLGLVEFRAFRMADTPERAACLAALLRAISAHLSKLSTPSQVKLWGRELHDRFALPFQLRLDLEEVLQELQSSGFGLAPAIAQELRREQRLLARVSLWEGAVLELRQAVEFWPLVGDLSAQSGTTRLVDSSTRRYELRLRCPEEQLSRWRLSVDGYGVPWATAKDADGPALLRAIRCRSFIPNPGLHPNLPAHGPLSALVYREDQAQAAQVTLHWWKVDGGAYVGLPKDQADALQRTEARCTVEHLNKPQRQAPEAPPGSLSAWAFDTRWAEAPR